MLRRRRWPGFALLEVMLGFAVSLVALTAVLRLSNRSVDNSGLAVREAQAGRYADEGMGWLRHEVADNGLDTVKSRAAADPDFLVYCINDLTWPVSGSGSCAAGTTIHKTDYFRQVALQVTTDAVTLKPIVLAVITIGWNEAGRSEEIKRSYEFVQF